MAGALKRILLGEGWGNAVGTLLLLTLGLALVLSEAEHLRGVLQAEPRTFACGAWLSSAREVRWVTLEGCAVEGGVAQGAAPPLHVKGSERTSSAALTGLVTREPGHDVLQLGQQPRRARVLGLTLAGLAVLAFALRPLFLRVLVEVALPAPSPPS